MGIGVSLAFIAIGAILAFALRVDFNSLNIQLVGWILILVGLISMGFTWKYTRPRRRGDVMAGADPGYVDEPGEPETIVHEERVIERPVDGGGTERVQRVVEHPGEPDPHLRHKGQDPAVAQDPSIAQRPGLENHPPVAEPERRPPHER